MMLERTAPVVATGWGCVVCDLPANGAVAVICDRCLESEAPIQWMIRGRPMEKQRIGTADYPFVAFDHDMSRHSEGE